MKPAIVIGTLIAIGTIAYALDRGIYVGEVRYVIGAEAVPNLDYIQKRCRYLFVTGVSEIDAHDGSQRTGIADCSVIKG